MKLGRIFSTYLKGYQPFEYWKERGKVYQKEFVLSKDLELEEKILVDYLKGINFESVLEVGCGFGRITNKILSNFQVKKYLAIDLSEDQIKNAKKLCVDFKNIQFRKSTIQAFKINEKFDLVLGVKVLLHVPPKEIESVIKKLIDLTSNHIVNVDFSSRFKPKIILPHNFVHKYKEIYSNDRRVNEVKEIPITEKDSLYHSKIILNQ